MCITEEYMTKTEFMNEIKNKYSLDTLIEFIDSIKDKSILVVGDTIIDEYQYGYTLGKSGKSPIVAFENKEIETYQGGVLAISNHLKEFCKVDVYTGNTAVHKKRYIQGNQKLFETYTYMKNDIDNSFLDEKEISNYDIVLIADFGHGFIDKKLQHKLESDAKYISLNTQLNAGNMGMNTINKYTHRNYVSIDFIELRLATSNQFDSISEIIRDIFGYETVSITEGRSGVFLYRNKELIHIPALADNVVDPIGAGDAYLSITTPLAYMKHPLEIIGLMGSTASSIACTYPGNSKYVTKDMMIDYLKRIYE